MGISILIGKAIGETSSVMVAIRAASFDVMLSLPERYYVSFLLLTNEATNMLRAAKSRIDPHRKSALSWPPPVGSASGVQALATACAMQLPISALWDLRLF